MKVILIILWKLWFYLIAILGILIIGPLVFLFTFKEYHIKIAFKLIRIWAKSVFFLTGFSYELILNKKLDTNKQYIMIANHTSMLDIMIFFIIHPKHLITFIGKKEIENIPIVGQIYRRICILVDRKSIKSRAKVYELTKEKINLKRNIIIFPEGGVPDDTSIILDNFKDGAFSMSISENLPIVIYSIKGLKESFPFEFTKGFPSKIKIELIDIIEPDLENHNPRQFLKEKCYQLILQNLIK